MNLEDVRNLCLSFPGVTEGFPFDENTLVFRVMDKMFLLVDVVQADRINIKCDPETAAELRGRYPTVLPGYHMNKTHWNTVMLKGVYPPGALASWIRDSYNLILASVPRRKRESAGFAIL